ncbi:MAG: PhoH family protein [Sedimentisphaerales bacterium]|nr:PhoH family protein [Sedimentisphaerales bacterium]
MTIRPQRCRQPRADGCPSPQWDPQPPAANEGAKQKPLDLTVTLDNPDQRMQLFGPADANLRVLREVCQVHITARDGQISLSGAGPSVAKAAQVLELMQQRLKQTGRMDQADMQQAILDAAARPSEPETAYLSVYVQGRRIEPRTAGQQQYVEAIRQNDLVFATGPAGTGKTYLAVACAVSLLKRHQIRRIVLARPAVEAGEKLGFLPGDLQAKVNPYLRPLLDALGDMMDYAQIKRFMLNDIIEVIPLAFMRGRTLNGALVILDEAQNTTVAQMLMFLTRMGHDSKMVVTGDDSQIDLADGQQSGLIDAMGRLRSIRGIAFVRLTHSDIVRHRLVQNIVQAYENHSQRGHD